MPFKFKHPAVPIQPADRSQESEQLLEPAPMRVKLDHFLKGFGVNI